ncbi:MAG: tRNA (adenosine(37)-N6)-threonylcarbamoyltransferase complex dimerization subunit type 1 TsaB, partial [Pseudomonadota bacterium]
SVAAARGLAMARKIPVAGVPVLDAMALDAGFSVVATEAPRGLLFSQFTGSAPVQSTFEDMPLPPAGTTAQVIGFRAGDIAERIGGVVRAPLYSLPEAIARAAMRMIQSGDVPLPVPLYIRPADAAPARDKPPVMLD